MITALGFGCPSSAASPGDAGRAAAPNQPRSGFPETRIGITFLMVSIGIAKPMFCASVAIAVLMPTTWPRRLRSGPRCCCPD